MLEILPRAEKVLTHTVQVTVPYALFEHMRLAITTHRGRLMTAEFGENAIVTARFAVEAFPAFDSALQEISAGTVHPEIVETLVALVPIQLGVFRPS